MRGLDNSSRSRRHLFPTWFVRMGESREVMLNLLRRILPSNRSNTGTIQLEHRELSNSEVIFADMPATEGRKKGKLIKANGETFFFCYEDDRLYYTFQEYGEWDGMVVEADIEIQSITTTDFGFPAYGWARRIFVRSLGTGKLFKLPGPEVMRLNQSSQQCRCPMCLGTLIQGKTSC